MDNNTIQTQARICPTCHDDHEDTRPCKSADLLARITTLEAHLAERDKAIRSLYQALVSAQAVSRMDAELIEIDPRKYDKRRELKNTAIWHSTQAVWAFEQVEDTLTPEPPTGEEQSSE